MTVGCLCSSVHSLPLVVETVSVSFVALTCTMQVLGTGFNFCFQHFQLHPLPSTDTNPVDDNYMGTSRLTLINDPVF